MAALGPPTWDADAWSTDAWAADTWEAAGGGDPVAGGWSTRGSKRKKVKVN